VPEDRSFSYALAYHVTTFIPITLLGLWSLARSPVGLSDLRRAPPPSPPSPPAASPSA